MKLQRPLEKFYAFLDQPLIFAHRVAIALSVAFLVLAFFFPLWRISMEAPQYPNGLWMDIWAYDLVGGGEDGRHIQEINTLNHYIGMHRIERADFADLDWMPFGFGLLAILALRVAAVGNVRSLVDLAVITTYVLAFAGARFVYKLYVFGHDLDPAAPFDVEPFMPVIIGTKQIANFTTHSMPQLGTLWVTLFALTVSVSALWHLVAGRRAALRRSREAQRAPAMAPAEAAAA